MSQRTPEHLAQFYLDQCAGDAKEALLMACHGLAHRAYLRMPPLASNDWTPDPEPVAPLDVANESPPHG